ncbi:hypothetical protein BC938DRAFT_473305, partial [Jimgerdemannia flammicorona]
MNITVDKKINKRKLESVAVAATSAVVEAHLDQIPKRSRFRDNIGHEIDDNIVDDETNVATKEADLTSDDELCSKRPKRRMPHSTIPRPPLLNLVPSDDDVEVGNREDKEGSLQEIDDCEDEEGVPLPDEIDFFFGQAKNKWVLPSGKNVGEIFAEKISINVKTIKNKKRPVAFEAILRYGVSGIIDLSSNMKGWFTLEDRKFMAKNHEIALRVPELPEDVNTFISTVED